MKLKTRSRLAAVFCSLGLITTLSLSSTPAFADHGSDNDILVCNSTASVASIEIPNNAGVFVDGACGNFYNGADNLFVDVEYDSSYQDVNSYKQGEIGVGYGGCHTNSENATSDVYDHANDNGARYRNFRYGNCTN